MKNIAFKKNHARWLNGTKKCNRYGHLSVAMAAAQAYLRGISWDDIDVEH
jgi:hypothetical protein